VHRDGRTRLVWGYHFDLNPSAGAHVAKDKAATFEVLRAAGVPAVEHRLFLRADLADYVNESGSWTALLAALDEFGGVAVLKPTEGSGGAGVSRVRSPRELEEKAAGLWQRHHAICLSPYHEVTREIRHILLDGEPSIIYEKEIRAIVGDGHSTLGQLLLGGIDDAQQWASKLGGAARQLGALAWDHVPAAGQRLPLAWKHNLRGARAIVPESRDEASLSLARRAAAALGLRLCAVDVIEAADGVGPRVLEVNAGLMLERYVEQVEGGWSKALALTREVVRLMFTA
jgi:glutathione synthase/RimK-type ligase-like ATP-grasp enzyme